jgi:hypothetical protein
MADALRKNEDVKLEMTKESATLEKVEEEVDTSDEAKPKEASGKLILAEEVAVGHVSWKACACMGHDRSGYVALIETGQGDYISTVLRVNKHSYFGHYTLQGFLLHGALSLLKCGSWDTGHQSMNTQILRQSRSPCEYHPLHDYSIS